MGRVATFDNSKLESLSKPRHFDVILLLTAIALVGFSVVMVYSTTGVMSQEKFGDHLYFVKRQLLAIVIGLTLMAACSRVSLRHLQVLSPFLLFCAAAGTLLPLLPGLGLAGGGAYRWVMLGPIRFQPAEFSKLFFVIFLAGFFARHESQLCTFSYGIFKPGLLTLLVAGPLLFQPDFGSFAILSVVSVIMAMLAGVRLRHIVFSVMTLAVGMGSLIAVSPYRMKRVLAFLSPFSDPAGKGYQLIQSLIAIGSGQTTGVGLGAGQQKLFYLPAAHTDFIFAVVGEELGFVGCSVLLLVFVIFLWRGLKLSSRLVNNVFAFSLSAGLTLIIVVPALLNVGVVTGLLPTKGLVLPLVGYGGSSIVASLMAVGLLLAVAREERAGLIPERS
ncbi:MAG: putative lipid II flippase FtsW [Candidatus Dadabacteria bacterium]|nr:MAG: putative lipid II flippase FtsW [Candidatus Dadabacteria bacterium]